MVEKFHHTFVSGIFHRLLMVEFIHLLPYGGKIPPYLLEFFHHLQAGGNFFHHLQAGGKIPPRKVDVTWWIFSTPVLMVKKFHHVGRDFGPPL